MTILFNNFRKLLKWNFVIIYIIIMSLVPIILGFVLKNEVYGKNMAIEAQISFTMGIYYILVFMWVLGIPFLIITSSKGISILANEFQEGTMSLLVSTKLSRIKIVFYKWLASYSALLLLGMVAIIENLSILYFISDMKVVIFNHLMLTLPNLLLYLVFIGFVFSTLAIALSLIIKSKVFATILMITIIIFTFLIIPLFKTFLMSYYEDYYLYFFDFNYHFSSIYYFFISNRHFQLTPSMQMILGSFIGIFDINSITDSDLIVTTGQTLLKEASIYNYLDAKTIIQSWALIGMFLLISSMMILQRRDVS